MNSVYYAAVMCSLVMVSIPGGGGGHLATVPPGVGGNRCPWGDGHGGGRYAICHCVCPALKCNVRVMAVSLGLFLLYSPQGGSLGPNFFLLRAALMDPHYGIFSRSPVQAIFEPLFGENVGVT